MNHTNSRRGLFKVYMVPSISPKGEQLSIHVDVVFDGAVIVRRTIEPLCDAARYLQAQGFSGRIELWDNQRKYARMTATISKAAALMVKETPSGPRFAKYAPHYQTAASEA